MGITGEWKDGEGSIIMLTTQVAFEIYLSS